MVKHVLVASQSQRDKSNKHKSIKATSSFLLKLTVTISITNTDVLAKNSLLKKIIHAYILSHPGHSNLQRSNGGNRIFLTDDFCQLKNFNVYFLKTFKIWESCY